MKNLHVFVKLVFRVKGYLCFVKKNIQNSSFHGLIAKYVKDKGKVIPLQARCGPEGG